MSPLVCMMIGWHVSSGTALVPGFSLSELTLAVESMSDITVEPPMQSPKIGVF